MIGISDQLTSFGNFGFVPPPSCLHLARIQATVWSPPPQVQMSCAQCISSLNACPWLVPVFGAPSQGRPGRAWARKWRGGEGACSQARTRSRGWRRTASARPRTTSTVGSASAVGPRGERKMVEILTQTHTHRLIIQGKCQVHPVRYLNSYVITCNLFLVRNSATNIPAIHTG